MFNGYNEKLETNSYSGKLLLVYYFFSEKMPKWLYSNIIIILKIKMVP